MLNYLMTVKARKALPDFTFDDNARGFDKSVWTDTDSKPSEPINLPEEKLTFTLGTTSASQTTTHTFSPYGIVLKIWGITIDADSGTWSVPNGYTCTFSFTSDEAFASAFKNGEFDVTLDINLGAGTFGQKCNYTNTMLLPTGFSVSFLTGPLSGNATSLIIRNISFNRKA